MFQAILLLIGIPALCAYIFGTMEQNKKKRAIEEQNLYDIELFDYCGGCDLVAKDTKVEVKWGKNNILTIVYHSAGVLENIPYDKINRVYARSERQIREDVTLTRLALFGIFAFGMKKESEDSKYYMVISYENEDNIEQNLILSCGASLQDNLNSYNQILKNYRTGII